MSNPIIEFSDYSFQYNAQAEPTLHHINFKVCKGEKVMIVGPSGCGKSTMVNCMNGLIPFTYKGEQTGSLKIRGKDTSMQSIAELSATVGTVLQDSDAQFIGMTVLEDIAFALENQNTIQPQMRAKVQEVAKMVEIERHLHYAPTELSGGQKQRVSIAGIMVDDVDVLLFDEPLANLDPATGKKAMELIETIQQQTGAAIIIVEHRLEDVLHCPVDRIVLMHEGRIVFDDCPNKLLSSSLLVEHGIREPLYVTALKYARVDVKEAMQPANIRTLQLSELQKQMVKAWYQARSVETKKTLGEPFLRLEHVNFAYDGKGLTLKDVNLQIQKGELVALVGKNGAGKSTLSKVICGFEQNVAGTMEMHGENLKLFSIKERADKIGYVMQNPNKMISKIMIYDEVALGLRMRQVAEDVIKDKVEKVLKTCGLYEFRNWPISALSYGQKKRVTIASILVLEPDMLILDEPTAGQDFHHYTDIMEFLKQLNETGLTILMITHDMHLMLEYAQRTIVFCDGTVIEDTTGAKVLTNQEVIEKAYLKETSLYDLALMCNISDPSDFVQHFINYDREVRCND